MGPRYAAAAEPPPETTKLRLTTAPVLCTLPARLAEEMLLLEGFQEIEYVASPTEDGLKLIASNRADFAQWDVPGVITKLDAGDPILVLAGLHAGCQELFANDRVRTPRDLKGKRIAVSAMGNGDHIFISSVLGYVGIHPHKEVTDPYTSGHSVRVSEYARTMARELGLSAKQVDNIETAALLHDVGKMYEEFVPLLRKEDKLTLDERRIMQSHPARGAELVSTSAGLRGRLSGQFVTITRTSTGPGTQMGLRARQSPRVRE